MNSLHSKCVCGSQVKLALSICRQISEVELQQLP